jgi:glycosyltransferase involved in cell wall biosynthesis
MHIRFLIMNAYAAGGTVRTTFTNAAELARRHDVEIVSVYKRVNQPRLTVPDGVRLSALSDESPDTRKSSSPQARLIGQLARIPSVAYPHSDPRYWTFNLLTDIRLVRYLRSLHGGVLVSTRPGLNILTARFVPADVTTVGQEHLHLSHHRPRLQRKIGRSYPRLDLVATLTSNDADDYRKVLGGRTRLETVPNAVPDLGGLVATSDRKVVISAGRLEPQKGFDRLVPAYASIAAAHPDWRLQIFGNGNSRAELSAQISDLDAEPGIALMGFSNALYGEMAHAAIYVMSSRFEGFPMVLLEAMGLGLPVISFDCRNGPADLIEHGRNGLLVPEGDVAGLAAAMSELMADEPRRRAMGAAARETAQTYAVSAVAARWESLFAELAAGKR